MLLEKIFWGSVQFNSVTQSCPTLCNSMDCSTRVLPVHHQVPELAQTHVHRVGDAIHHLIFCRPLLLPSVFPRIRVFSNESALTYQMANVLELQLQHQSLQWIFRVDFPLDWLVWSPQLKEFSKVFSNTTVQKHQFFGAQPSLWSSSHIHTWLLEKPSLWLDGPLLTKNVPSF